MEGRNHFTSEGLITPVRPSGEPSHWKKRRPFDWKERGEEFISAEEKEKPFNLEAERVRMDKILSFLLPRVMKRYSKDIVYFIRDLQKKNAKGDLNLDAEYAQMEKDYFDPSNKDWSEEDVWSSGVKLSFLRNFLDPSYHPETAKEETEI